MTECLLWEMLCNNKLLIVSVIYRSPNQSSQEFLQFEILFSQHLMILLWKNLSFPIILSNLKQVLSVGGALKNKIGNVTVYFQLFQLVVMIFGDFNARSKCCWSLDKQNRERDSLFSIRSTRGYTQMIKSATHFIGNSSSCVDLIFTQQPNQVSSGGVHASLHNNCHHQITLSQTSLFI